MIHYHGCPLSGGTFTQTAYTAKHAMISFANKESAALIVEVCQSFCVDNGAFSFWKSGKDIDLKGFAEFLEAWHRHPAFDFYCLPDVIEGDHHDNQAIRSRWFSMVPRDIYRKGVPVWHLHEPLSVLQEMMPAYDRIALGSSGEYAIVGDRNWWDRMGEAMSVLCDEAGRPKVKIHGLRMLDPTIFSQFPFSSADSTNVARNCGIDKAWGGPYAPKTPRERALVMMGRIEAHASASTWAGHGFGGKNMDLFG